MSSPLTRDDPERIGGYWLAARLGAGGQGVVYEAYDASGARYALKTLHTGAESFARDRFAREADSARRVAAFCTARIVRAGVDGDVPYIVSEYVPGPTLSARVHADGPLGPEGALRLAVGVATALAAIHQAGVIHRDLKPGNVLLGPDGPRIIDFGIARAPEMSLTATGAVMGTLGYMAPEVLAGHRATEASDIFAWAAVVVYAASGTEPFRGENIGEVVHRTATVDPDLGALPARVRPLIAAALAKEPELRPTAADLLLGLVGAPVEAADPRRALLEAGARKASTPADQAPDAGEHHDPTSVEAPLGERAEAAWSALSPTAGAAARELLLRLTVPGSAADGSQDTVRTAAPAELFADRAEAEHSALAEAAEALTGAGVLVTEADGSVRPVSAALLPAWRRLRAWADADRTALETLHRVGAAARRWEAHGGRTEDLPRGTELRQGLDWLTAAPYHLRPNPLERRFLAAARDEETRAARRRRRLLSGLAGVSALALLAGGVAWTQNQQAELRRTQATARAVAQSAESLRSTDPTAAMLLGLASWRIAEVPEARGALNTAALQLERGVLPLRPLDAGDESGRLLSADGRRLVTYSPLGVQVWETGKGPGGAERPLVELTPDAIDLSAPLETVLSADGTYLLLRQKDGRPRLLRTEDGKFVGKPVADRKLKPLGVSDEGHMLFGTESRGVRVLDRSGRHVVTEPSGTLLAPDGGHTVHCGFGSMVVRRAEKDAPSVVSQTFKDDKGKYTCPDLLFSPDGSHLAASGDRRTFVWDLESGKLTATLATGPIAPRFSSGGRFLVGWSEQDGAMEVWPTGQDASQPLAGISTADTDTAFVDLALDERAEVLRHVPYGSERMYETDVAGMLDHAAPKSGASDEGGEVGAALSPDGRTGLVREGEENPTLRLIDLADGKTIGDPVTQGTPVGPVLEHVAALSDGGTVLAYTDGEGGSGEELRREVAVRDTKAGKEILRIPVTVEERVHRLVVAPDGRHLAATFAPAGSVPSAEGSAVQVWDLRSGRKVRELPGDYGHGVFSPDGRTLVTTTGYALDLAAGSAREDVLGAGRNTDLVFSPDGKQVAVLKESGLVELWDGALRERKATMPSGLVRGGDRHGGYARTMSFSADGGQLAVLLDADPNELDGDAVQLWDTAARIPLGPPLVLGGRPADAVAFHGQALRTLTGDRVHTVDLTPSGLAKTICRKAGRDLTEDEWRTYIPDEPYRKLC
ncbi:protein kinase [Streptomyces sp. NPDC058374]|uniref:protein kinase domain-containing protein n=1 Tax=Streptomyces sp. NPDC058374 TaxID=3346466 RepID=UPI00365A8BB7